MPRTPESLIQSILRTAHDESGHNGFPRTYSAIRRLYYWKESKKTYFSTAGIATRVNYTRLLQ